MTRRGEIERFIRGSGLPGAERAVFRDLLNCADNATGRILPEHAWKASYQYIAGRVGYSKSSVVAYVEHLERHRMIAAGRSPGGQGNVNHYVLLPPGAEVCECPSRYRAEPKTPAQRQREYRQRQKRKATQTVTRNRPFERSDSRNENVDSPGAAPLGTSTKGGNGSPARNELYRCLGCRDSLAVELVNAGLTRHEECQEVQ